MVKPPAVPISLITPEKSLLPDPPATRVLPFCKTIEPSPESAPMVSFAKNSTLPVSLIAKAPVSVSADPLNSCKTPLCTVVPPTKLLLPARDTLPVESTVNDPEPRSTLPRFERSPAPPNVRLKPGPVTLPKPSWLNSSALIRVSPVSVISPVTPLLPPVPRSAPPLATPTPARVSASFVFTLFPDNVSVAPASTVVPSPPMPPRPKSFVTVSVPAVTVVSPV